MTVHDIDVIGIGNALVDVLTHEEDEFVAAQGLVKGSMTLIDAARAPSSMLRRGKSSRHGSPVAGLIEAGPLLPRQLPSAFGQMTK